MLGLLSGHRCGWSRSRTGSLRGLHSCPSIYISTYRDEGHAYICTYNIGWFISKSASNWAHFAVSNVGSPLKELWQIAPGGTTASSLPETAVLSAAHCAVLGHVLDPGYALQEESAARRFRNIAAAFTPLRSRLLRTRLVGKYIVRT